MLKKRIIPSLLMKNSGLVKGKNFKDHCYVGDPINAVKIFNQKEVDELVFLDISARINEMINYELISDIAAEAFMPLAYGGGVSDLKKAEKILFLGFEKIIINSEFYYNPNLIKNCANAFGSSSVVVSIDIKEAKNGNYQVMIENGSKEISMNLFDYIKKAEDFGAGELFICCIDKEGTRKGFDINIFKKITEIVSIPIIASGGASSLLDFQNIFTQTNISAASAGELFIFFGKHRAVLINYPEYEEIENFL